MRIDMLVQRWLDCLVAVFYAWRETWRARRTLIVTRSAEHFIVRRPQPTSNAIMRTGVPDDEAPLAAIMAGTPVPADLARTARNGLVVFELSPESVALRRMSVPAQAREFLPGIVRNQIERLSPWHANQVIHGFDASAAPDDASMLEVRILIAPRAELEAAQDELAVVGLPLDRVVACPDELADGGPVVLWSRLADLTPDGATTMRRRLAVGVAVTVLLCLALSAWAFTSARSIGADSEATALRAKTLQRQIQGPRTAEALASASPAERLWHARETSPAAMLVLERLSQALPDTAYLTELQLDRATLRMIGLATDAPVLIAPLEASKAFADVHFFAPTTRDADGSLFRFYIEARIAPQSPTPEAAR